MCHKNFSYIRPYRPHSQLGLNNLDLEVLNRQAKPFILNLFLFVYFPFKTTFVKMMNLIFAREKERRRSKQTDPNELNVAPDPNRLPAYDGLRARVSVHN